MPDGTHTRIYLLQFDTAVVADRVRGHVFGANSPDYLMRGIEDSELDADFPAEAKLDEVTRTAYVEAKPYGAEQVRQAGLPAGDTFAVILQSRKGAAPAVPFRQTVTLQSRLLG